METVHTRLAFLPADQDNEVFNSADVVKYRVSKEIPSSGLRPENCRKNHII